MAGTCVEDGAGPHLKGRLKMDTTRQKKTWEANQMNLSWGEAQHAARDRVEWRVLIEALCPLGDEE